MGGGGKFKINKGKIFNFDLILKHYSLFIYMLHSFNTLYYILFIYVFRPAVLNVKMLSHKKICLSVRMCLCMLSVILCVYRCCVYIIYRYMCIYYMHIYMYVCVCTSLMYCLFSCMHRSLSCVTSYSNIEFT